MRLWDQQANITIGQLAELYNEQKALREELARVTDEKYEIMDQLGDARERASWANADVERMRLSMEALHERLSAANKELARLRLQPGDYNVWLQDFGCNKISAIKVVREVLQLGLKECKDLVESAPTNVAVNISLEGADSFARALRDVGCNATAVANPAPFENMQLEDFTLAESAE